MHSSKDDGGGKNNPSCLNKMITFFRYANGYDFALFSISILLALASGLVTPLENIILGKYFEAYLYGHKEIKYNGSTYDAGLVEKMVHEYTYYHVTLAFFVLISLFFSASFGTILIERQIKVLKKVYFKSILRQDMTFFEKNPPGEVASSMSINFDKIRSGLNLKLTLSVCSCGYVISSIIVALHCSSQLGLTMFGSTLVIIIPLVLGIYFDKNLQHKELLYSSSIGALVEEVLSGIKTVMSFNGQFFEIQRYSNAVQKLLFVTKRKLCAITTTCCFFYFFIYSQNALYIYFGYNLIINKKLMFGELICILFTSIGISFRLQELMYQVLKFKEGLSYVLNVLEVIDTEPKIDSLSNEGETIENVCGNIVFKNITFNYDSRPNERAADDISFNVNAGESCALVGKSGSGKSTIMNLLMRYYELKSGEILIDGKRHDTLNINWLRGITSIVSQEPVLFTGTIRENILVGNPNASDEDIRKACKLAYAEDFIEALPDKYNTFIGEGQRKMSGGQKQRIAIARALVRNPKILILDEATSALDASSERKVLTALNEASKGRTTLAISHKLNFVKNYDKIMVFSRGKIVESGKHDELMKKKGQYYKLFMCEMQGNGNKKIDDSKLKQNDDGISVKKYYDEGNEKQFMKTESFGLGMIVGKCIPTLEPKEMLKKLTGFAKNNDNIYLNENIIEEDSLIKKSLNMVLKGQNKPIKVVEKKTSFVEILQFSKKEMKRFFLGFIFVCIKALFYPVTVLIMGYIFETFADSLDSDLIKPRITMAILFIVGSSFGNTIIYAVCCYLIGLTGIKLSENVRLASYTNIMRQDITFFDDNKNGIGSLTKAFSMDALLISQGINLTCTDALVGVVTILISLIFTSYSNIFLGLTAVALMVSVSLISYTLTTIMHSILHRCAILERKSENIGLECINNVKTIQALSRIEEMSERFSESLNKVCSYKINSGIVFASSFSLGYSAIIKANALAYSGGTKLITYGFATPYDIVQGCQYIQFISFAFCLINPYIADYVPFRVAATKLFQIIQKIPKLDNLSSKGKKSPISGNIQMKSGYFAYPHIPNHLVLKGMSFKINFGESLTLVGMSGCGKSTTMQILERMYDLLDGTLEIDGINIKEYNIQHYRNYISIVSQEPILFNLSIKENICYGLENVDDEEIREAATIANIHDFIEALPQKYDTPVGIKGGDFSGGEKQRIAIARALVRKPNILLLDEATSALDTQNSIDVQEALEKAKVGRTCINISHKLNSVVNSTYIGYVEDGKIIEFGNHEKLMKMQGSYYKLVQQQQLD
uniref:ABC-type xenobiotic transporter n=1 Tax=Parastrongyloides trichosuri TaxID=131310 RepID=A0A0N4ZTN2_PARTI